MTDNEERAFVLGSEAVYREMLGTALSASFEVAATEWEKLKAGIVEAFAGIGGPECGFLAGDPCAGAVYPSGGLGKRGPKRPGQWGWRARMLRARRLDRAAERKRWRAHLWEEGTPPNRATRRMVARRDLEWRARANYGIEPLPGETTTSLRDRVLRARIRACVPPGPTRADLAALTGGVVEVDNATATVLIRMPAGTSAERCEEVRAEVADRVPAGVCLEVVCATS
jgi:hypothetical protein